MRMLLYSHMCLCHSNLIQLCSASVVAAAVCCMGGGIMMIEHALPAMDLYMSSMYVTKIIPNGICIDACVFEHA